MTRLLYPPSAPTTFPIAATTITDNFTRADENPIGSPWNLAAWAGSEAAISSNKFVSQDRTGFWEGGATYPWPSVSGFEIIATLATNLTVSGPAAQIGASSNAILDHVYVDLGFAYVVAGDSILNIAATPVIGSQIGLRTIGSTLEGWYRASSSLQWSLIGRLSRISAAMTIPPAGGPYLYAYADNYQIAFSDFSIAPFGQLIPQTPPRRSRRTSW